MNAARITRYDSRTWGVEMNRARALYVRTLRVEHGHSWRSVALACAEQWGGDWGDNQLAGIAFCHSAATTLGENPDHEPWN